jgi:hypothetical protein
MKKETIRNILFIVPILVSFLATTVISENQSNSQKGHMGNFWQKQTITAEIVNVDKKKSEVTLKGPKGKEVSFVVDKNIDLSNIKKGDSVRAEYFRSVLLDLTKPTPEQEKQQYTILETRKIAPAGVDIAGGSLRQIKAVATVKKIDKSKNQIVVDGPEGNEYTLTVPDKKLLDVVKEGQNAVITYTEALATNLEKTK